MRFLHNHAVESLIIVLTAYIVSAELSYPLIFGSYIEVPEIKEPVKQLRQARAGGFTSAKNATLLLNSWLAKCPADTFLVVNQPGVSVSDFQNYVTEYGFSLWTELRKLYARLDTLASFSRLDEAITLENVVTTLQRRCLAEHITVVPGEGLFDKYIDSEPRVITVEFPELSSDPVERAHQLFANDKLLLDIMSRTPSASYAVIYTSTTGEDFGTGHEFYKQKHLDIFSDLVRMNQNKHQKEHQNKQTAMPQKTKAPKNGGGDKKPLPPKAMLDRQKDKVLRLREQRKHLQESDSWLLAVVTRLDQMLTVDTLLLVLSTNMVLLVLYIGVKLARTLTRRISTR